MVGFLPRGALTQRFTGAPFLGGKDHWIDRLDKAISFGPPRHAANFQWHAHRKNSPQKEPTPLAQHWISPLDYLQDLNGIKFGYAKKTPCLAEYCPRAFVSTGHTGLVLLQRVVSITAVCRYGGSTRPRPMTNCAHHRDACTRARVTQNAESPGNPRAMPIKKRNKSTNNTPLRESLDHSLDQSSERRADTIGL